MKIKKGDEVIVVAGKDKGATGTVLRALPQRERVVVEGVNLMKKHKRASQTSGGQGEVVTQEAPIHISNVSLVEDGEPTRAGYRFDEDGTKIRISRRTGKDI